jgi:hypothetical protein
MFPCHWVAIESFETSDTFEKIHKPIRYTALWI